MLPAVRRRGHPAQTEHLEQVALFEWATIQVQTRRHPELRLLFAIPNGGERSESVASELKKEGLRPGVPDVCLPVPRGSYASLFLELKRPAMWQRPKGRVSPEQRWWIEELQAAGNMARIAYGWDQARAIIEGYLALALPWHHSVGPNRRIVVPCFDARKQSFCNES